MASTSDYEASENAGRMIMLSSLIGNAAEIQKRLLERLKYRPQYQINYIMSQNEIICCFLDKRLYLTDINLNPLIAYESTSYIHACTISATAKYMLCQTANNRQNDSDSGATILFDVKKKCVIAKCKIPTGWKGVTHIFIDERSKCVWLYYGNSKISYGFDLKTSQEKLDNFCAEICQQKGK